MTTLDQTQRLPVAALHSGLFSSSVGIETGITCVIVEYQRKSQLGELISPLTPTALYGLRHFSPCVAVYICLCSLPGTLTSKHVHKCRNSLSPVEM